MLTLCWEKRAFLYELFAPAQLRPLQLSGSLMETKSCWIHMDEANRATEVQRGVRHSHVHQEAAERWRIQAGEGSRDPGNTPPTTTLGRMLQEPSGTSCFLIISTRAAGGSCVCSRRLWGREAELASYGAPHDPECCWAESTPPCTSYRTQLQGGSES